MQDRNFKGIWIPKEIWLSSELTLQEKVFLVEIDSLDNENGCFAGNQYFSDFFGVSKVRVSEVINSLVKKGYITSTIIYKEGSKQILKRVLKVSLIGYKRKVEEGIKEKFKDSNTINNTVNISFDDFWKIYKGKKLLKVKCEEKWNKLSNKDRELIIKHLPFYEKSVSEIKYLKHAMTYLNSKMWLDDFEEVKKQPIEEVKLTEKTDWRKTI